MKTFIGPGEGFYWAMLALIQVKGKERSWMCRYQMQSDMLTIGIADGSFVFQVALLFKTKMTQTVNAADSYFEVDTF